MNNLIVDCRFSQLLMKIEILQGFNDFNYLEEDLVIEQPPAYSKREQNTNEVSQRNLDRVLTLQQKLMLFNHML